MADQFLNHLRTLEDCDRQLQSPAAALLTAEEQEHLKTCERLIIEAEEAEQDAISLLKPGKTKATKEAYLQSVARYKKATAEVIREIERRQPFYLELRAREDTRRAIFMRKSQLSQAFAAGAIVTTQEGHGALAPVPQGEPPAGGATGQGPAGLGQPAAAVQPIPAAAAARQVATAAAAAATTVPVQYAHVLDIEEQVDTEGFPALAQTLGPLAPPAFRQAAPQGASHVLTERPERGVRRAVEGPLEAAVLPPSKVPRRLTVQGAGILDSWLDTLATGPGAGMTATGAQRSALGPFEKTLTSSIDMEDTAAMAPFMSELLAVAGVQRLSTNQDIFNSHAKSVISATSGRRRRSRSSPRSASSRATLPFPRPCVG
ncbi:hypothetical protein Agub_g12731 [Astrephomene gubernaculifera]|uniref:Uncharacterized protein n=1 Tax=Astrephomene gubernaculifera TaxID=47775 RepID=A0AAD3HRV2_9CHLO|nr:hypothetical protein Agub_g12731 [Astrephomene gubernaculifera]